MRRLLVVIEHINDALALVLFCGAVWAMLVIGSAL